MLRPLLRLWLPRETWLICSPFLTRPSLRARSQGRWPRWKINNSINKVRYRETWLSWTKATWPRIPWRLSFSASRKSHRNKRWRNLIIIITTIIIRGYWAPKTYPQPLRSWIHPIMVVHCDRSRAKAWARASKVKSKLILWMRINLLETRPKRILRRSITLTFGRTRD